MRLRRLARLNDPGRALDKHGSKVGLELRHRREKEARFRLGEDGHGSTGSMAEAGELGALLTAQELQEDRASRWASRKNLGCRSSSA